MSNDWERAERILCVRLDSLGDVLMTSPAIRAVRAARPRAHLTLLTSPAGAAVGHLVPEIDEVIAYEAPWMKASGARAAADDRAFVDQLTAHGFDAAIIFTVFSQSALPAALMCRLAGIPLALAHARERAYALLSDAIAESEPEQGIRHEVRRQLDLVGTLGWRTGDERLSLRATAAGEAAADAIVAELGLSDGRWVLLHPGASAPSRRWPLENFAAVIGDLAAQGRRLVVAGGHDEAAMVAELTASHPAAHPVIGLGLDAFVALTAQAPLVICNNSGPAHIAAAVGTPSVVLYAGTNPQHTPWSAPTRVLTHPTPCAPCFKSLCPEGHHACLRDVTPAQVIAAAFDLVGRHPAVA